MGEHPKRRKDKYNPYSIYEKEGTYYISFRDGQGKLNRFEISKDIYEAFDTFELEDISYLNVWDRHIEQSEVWEPTLDERAVEVQQCRVRGHIYAEDYSPEIAAGRAAKVMYMAICLLTNTEFEIVEHFNEYLDKKITQNKVAALRYLRKASPEAYAL